MTSRVKTLGARFAPQFTHVLGGVGLRHQLILSLFALSACNIEGRVLKGDEIASSQNKPSSTDVQDNIQAKSLSQALQAPGKLQSSSFVLKLNLSDPVLKDNYRQPRAEPVSVQAVGEEPFGLQGRVKTVAARPGYYWLDVFIENKQGVSLKNAQLEVSGQTAFADVSHDPYADVLNSPKIMLGGVGAEGLAYAAVLFAADRAAEEVVFEVKVTAQVDGSKEASASPIQVTDDSKEVWAAQSDLNQVFVVDALSDTKIAAIDVGGRPESLALTKDNRFVLVVLSDVNLVVVIERGTKAITQVLSESDGLGRNPRSIVASPKGTEFFVSAYVSDTLSRIVQDESGIFRIDGALKLGRRPAGLAISADGNTLFVSHFLPRGKVEDNESWVSIVQSSPLRLVRESVMRDFGNLKESRCLNDKFNLPNELLSFEGAATQLSGVFLAPGGQQGWLPGVRIGPVLLYEGLPGRFPGMSRGTFSPSFLFFLDTRSQDVAGFREHPLLLDIPDVSLDFLKCAKLDYSSESPKRTPYQGSATEMLSRGAVEPTGVNGLGEAGLSRFIAFSRGGRRALALSYSADEVQLFDTFTQHQVSQKNLLLSGSNPIALALTPDGKKGFVLYENSVYLSVLDLSAIANPEKLPGLHYNAFQFVKPDRPGNSLVTALDIVRNVAQVDELPPIQETKQIQLAEKDSLETAVRRGKVLFSSSSPVKWPELSESRQAACTTCHPGGGHDGSLWATMEGERRTVSLYGGVGGRGWLHASGTHKDAQEFADAIVRERLGGSGLSESDRDALSGYVAFHLPKLQAPLTDSEKVKRGELVFQSKCASCHFGSHYGGGLEDPANRWGGGFESGPLLIDVGSATAMAYGLLPVFFTDRFPSPSKEMYHLLHGDRDLGPSDFVQQTVQFKARPDRKKGQFRPTPLTGVWDYNIFFHDGQFTTLEQSVNYLNERLGLQLSADEIADVVEYVKTL